MFTGYFTTMHDWFVTWPPFYTIIIYVKGGQVTKPIMHSCGISCEHIFEANGFLINN